MFSFLTDCLLHERNVIVLADALQNEEGRRALSAIGDEVRPARPNRIGVTGAEMHLLLGLAQEELEASLNDVERILNMGMVMPRHLLGRRDLEFGNAEAGPLGMMSPALDYIELAGVLDWFHGFLHFVGCIELFNNNVAIIPPSRNSQALALPRTAQQCRKIGRKWSQSDFSGSHPQSLIE